MRIAGNSDWKGERQGQGWGMRMGSYIRILSSEFDLYSVGMNESIIDEVGVSQRAISIGCPYWLRASRRSSRMHSFPGFYHFSFTVHRPYCSIILDSDSIFYARMLPFVYKIHMYTFFLSSGIDPPQVTSGAQSLSSLSPSFYQFASSRRPVPFDVRTHEKRRARLMFSSREVTPRFTFSFTRQPVTTQITPFRSSLFTDFVQTYLRQSLRYLSRPSHTHTSRSFYRTKQLGLRVKG